MGPKIDLGNGITVRVFERSDVPALFNAIQKNRVYLREWKAWYEKMQTKQLVQVFIDENHRQFDNLITQAELLSTHPGVQFGMFNSENMVLGLVGYQGINVRNKVAALGYWIDEDWQGKGIVTSAVQKLIEYGWDVFDIHRYEIQAWIGNMKSAKVAERLGFKKEAILKEIELRDGEFLDHYLYRLVPSDLK